MVKISFLKDIDSLDLLHFMQLCRMWSQVKNNYTEIESDLQRKIDISSELTAFSREKSNRNLTVAQLLISVVTFVLLIFPEKALSIADWIKTLWTLICQLFAR